jgi:hypothetical protein
MNFLIKFLIQPTATADMTMDNCLGFVAISGNAMSFTGLTTTISSGSIGSTQAIGSGYVLQNGHAYVNTVEVSSCRTDADTAFVNAGAASGIDCDFVGASNILAALDGLNLLPGKYCGAAMTLAVATAVVGSGVLILDAQNYTDSQWIFRSSASVDIGVGSSVKIINGGSAKNVFWILDTSLNTGVDSSFVGIVICKTSIVLGVRTTVEGRGIALTTVSFYDDITFIMPPLSPTGQPSSQPTTVPSSQPSRQPTSNPTGQPSRQPTSNPTNPSGKPTCQPTSQPTREPSMQPR